MGYKQRASYFLPTPSLFIKHQTAKDGHDHDLDDGVYDHDLDNGVYDHDLDDHHHDFDYGNNFCFRSKDLWEGACLHRSETHKRPVHKSFRSFS